ncbi:MAG: hypothetical protein NTY19_13375 [Planctomycetota bacterium]|nr:hypothetical protein [Planctomycetota bacterium]
MATGVLAGRSFRSWATAEVKGGDRQRLAEISAEMSKILAPGSG